MWASEPGALHRAAFILTKNRPEMLGRAVDAITGHHPDLPIVVIDNSGRTAAAANRRILEDAETDDRICHMRRSDVRALGAEIRSISGRPHLDALCGGAPRDISGSRNLSLILSRALDLSTVFCVDDDMVTCRKDLGRPCFFDTVTSSHAKRSNAVIGGRMAGIMDDSYAGRLWSLCETGSRAVLYDACMESSRTEWRQAGHPLWRDSRAARARPKRASHASGGLMAVQVPRRSLLPFPPGYNEDWNWCLLQSVMRGTAVLTDGRPSYHSPPGLRDLGAADIAWESLGDAMFYALRRASKERRRFALSQLRNFVISNDSIGIVKGQLTRTANLLDSVAESNGEAGALRARKKRVERAARMLAAQDFGAFVRSWFGAQEARMNSLGYILETPEAKHVIRAVLDESAA